jgi:hypothetical protein
MYKFYLLNSIISFKIINYIFNDYLKYSLAYSREFAAFNPYIKK